MSWFFFWDFFGFLFILGKWRNWFFGFGFGFVFVYLVIVVLVFVIVILLKLFWWFVKSFYDGGVGLVFMIYVVILYGFMYLELFIEIENFIMEDCKVNMVWCFGFGFFSIRNFVGEWGLLGKDFVMSIKVRGSDVNCVF